MKVNELKVGEVYYVGTSRISRAMLLLSKDGYKESYSGRHVYRDANSKGLLFVSLDSRLSDDELDAKAWAMGLYGMIDTDKPIAISQSANEGAGYYGLKIVQPQQVLRTAAEQVERNAQALIDQQRVNQMYAEQNEAQEAAQEVVDELRDAYAVEVHAGHYHYDTKHVEYSLGDLTETELRAAIAAVVEIRSNRREA